MNHLVPLFNGELLQRHPNKLNHSRGVFTTTITANPGDVVGEIDLLDNLQCLL